MPRTQVKCNARNCAHWLPGDVCDAGRIEVVAQAGDRATAGPGDTLCRTFLNRRGLGQVISTLDNLNWAGLVQEPFRAGTQTTPAVTCRVRNCFYWSGGDACRARSIQVSGEGASLPGETDCSTFLARS